jgi:hypothetical protein
MNEIAFVVATYDYGIGDSPGVTPVIDGVSMVDRFAEAEGEVWYAGLTPPEPALLSWESVLTAGGISEMQILGCTCGDSHCSSAGATVEVLDDAVVWSDFRGTNPRADKPGAYAQIGPYRFDRAQYAAALANPATT